MNLDQFKHNDLLDEDELQAYEAAVINLDFNNPTNALRFLSGIFLESGVDCFKENGWEDVERPYYEEWSKGEGESSMRAPPGRCTISP